MPLTISTHKHRIVCRIGIQVMDKVRHINIERLPNRLNYQINSH